MRRLPLDIPPIDGESIYGYILRLTSIYGLPPGDITIALGFWEGGEKFDRRAAPFSLSPWQLANISSASGIPQARLKAMTLEHLDGRVFHADRSVEHARGIPAGIGKRVPVWDTAYCPDCLAETRTWFLDWHSRWTLLCERHRKILVETCPDCGVPPSDLRRLRWPTSHGDVETDLTKCRWKVRGRLCRFDLSRVEARRVSDDVLNAHSLLSAMIHGESRAEMAGEEIDPVALISDVTGLMHIVRLKDERHTPRLLDNRYAKAPSNVPEIASSRSEKLRLLPEAMKLAAISDRNGLVEVLRRIGETAFKNARHRLPPLTQFPGCSEPFAAALRSANDQCSWAKPGRVHGYERRRHTRPVDLDARLEVRHVPQLFWKAPFEQEILPLLDEVPISLSRARLLCSAILVRMLAPASWSEAAQNLGIEGALPRNPALEVNMSNLRSAGRDDAVITKIKQIANQMAHDDVLVDFRALSKSLASWAGVDRLTFRYLHQAQLPRKLLGDSQTRREYLSSSIWANLTQRDESDSPFWGAKQRYNYDRFKRTYFERVSIRVSLFEGILAAHPDSSQEFLRDLLVGELVARGELSPKVYVEGPSKELVDRTLTIVSHHTGVDIPSMLVAGSVRKQPVGVLHARELSAAILRRLSGSCWASIFRVLQSESRMSNLCAEYQSWSKGSSKNHELGLLVDRVKDGSLPLPCPAGPEPHSERMFRLAETIRDFAFALTDGKLSIHDQTSVSLAGCRMHTDLRWPALEQIHGIGERLTRFKYNQYRWYELPVEAQVFARQVVARAEELRCDQGYKNAYVSDLRGVREEGRDTKLAWLLTKR